MAVSGLTSHLGYWLRAVSNHVSLAFAAKVADRGVTVAEWVVLRALYGREPTSPSRIAAELGMTRGAITRLADRLIAKSLVIRRPDPRDGRAQSLELTPAAQALVPELAALADANDAQFFDHLSPGERAALEALLRDMVDRHRMTETPVD